MAAHGNLVAGEWVSGADINRNLNPSNLDDVVGEYAQADAAQANRPSPRRWRPRRRGRAATSRSAPTLLDRIGNEILARKEELGTLLSREEGKTLPEGIGEAARAGHIFKFFAGEVLRLTGEQLPSVRPGRRRRDHARAGRRRRHDHAVELPDRDPGLEDRAGARLRQLRRVQAGRSRARLRLGAGRHHQPRRAPAGRVQPGDGARLGGRRGAREPRRTSPAISFTGSVETGRGDRAEGGRAHGARCSSRWAARTRWSSSTTPTSTSAVNCAVQGAFFSTGQRCTASSPPDRDRGHPRPLRRGDGRAAQGAEGRRRAASRAPTSGPSSTRASSTRTCATSRSARRRARKLAWGGERSKRDAEGFYLAPALFTETTNAMRINREEIFGPVASVIRVRGLRRGAGGRQRHASSACRRALSRPR